MGDSRYNGNREVNGNYRGEKKKPHQTSSVGRNAYEIRTDILRLAFEIERERYMFKEIDSLLADNIVATAEKLNSFISKKSE